MAACREHPDAVLIDDYRAGDLICSTCGLVVGDRVVNIEWRPPANDNTRTDPPCYAKYPRVRLSSAPDPMLIRVASEIGNMAHRAHLPSCITDRASFIYKQMYNQNALKGRSVGLIAAACLYIACRQEDVPRTFKEICAISFEPKKDIGRCFKLILKTIETRVTNLSTSDFMSRLCNHLDLPMPLQRAATCIAQRAVQLDAVPGRSPISVAAAAIYMTSQASANKKSQRQIGDFAGVADVTIRQAYKLMICRATELFPSNFKFVTPIEQLPVA
jgi:transcription initiation factor TFIIB